MSRERKQLRMTWWGKRGHDFAGSLYRETCPQCGAEPFCWCRTESGRRIDPHPERRGAAAPPPGRTRGRYSKEVTP
jgi:hypothetical protein